MCPPMTPLCATRVQAHKAAASLHRHRAAPRSRSRPVFHVEPTHGNMIAGAAATRSRLMAGFGTHGYHHPRRCDRRAIEACTPVRASHLAARGAFVGAGTTTRWQYPGFTITVVAE